MFQTTHQTLKNLAALVWGIGVVVLILKSSGLFIQAHYLKESKGLISFAVGLGVIIGFVKSRFLFTNICNKNLTRISALKYPRLWQFYRPRFFVFLLCMICLGRFLAQIAAGNYPMLISVAILELSVGTALLFSIKRFWQNNSP